MVPPVSGKLHAKPLLPSHQEPNWPSWLRSQPWRLHVVLEFMGRRSYSWGAKGASRGCLVQRLYSQKLQDMWPHMLACMLILAVG